MNTMLSTLAILFARWWWRRPPVAARPGGGNIFIDLPMLVVFAAFWYFILYLPMKRERARQAALLGLDREE